MKINIQQGGHKPNCVQIILSRQKAILFSFRALYFIAMKLKEENMAIKSLLIK